MLKQTLGFLGYFPKVGDLVFWKNIGVINSNSIDNALICVDFIFYWCNIWDYQNLFLDFTLK